MSTSPIVTRWIGFTPYLLSLLRMVAASLFMQYGATKLFGYPAAVMPGGGTATLNSLPGLAGLLELGGGTLLLLGLFTRPTAFVLSGLMAAAYYLGHSAQGPWPVLNGGAPAVVFCFLWLYISAAGPGPISLDAFRGRSRGR